MKTNIDKSILKKLKIVAIKYNLDILILFGSRAKNKAKETSDYDLAFFKKKELTIQSEIAFFEEIEDIFKQQKFDLVNMNKNKNVVLIQEIYQNGICIYEKKEKTFKKEKEYAYFDYIDSFALLKPTKDKFLSTSL